MDKTCSCGQLMRMDCITSFVMCMSRRTNLLRDQRLELMMESRLSHCDEACAIYCGLRLEASSPINILWMVMGLFFSSTSPSSPALGSGLLRHFDLGTERHSMKGQCLANALRAMLSTLVCSSIKVRSRVHPLAMASKPSRCSRLKEIERWVSAVKRGNQFCAMTVGTCATTSFSRTDGTALPSALGRSGQQGALRCRRAVACWQKRLKP
mmetsp:Transcript_20672/g.36912  ORF Transcript_20672/g.36912 Transcript_20672/m.36912 type:complete len:210 (-) Transcript_20672:412-1041(-)